MSSDAPRHWCKQEVGRAGRVTVQSYGSYLMPGGEQRKGKQEQQLMMDLLVDPRYIYDPGQIALNCTDV